MQTLYRFVFLLAVGCTVYTSISVQACEEEMDEHGHDHEYLRKGHNSRDLQDDIDDCRFHDPTADEIAQDAVRRDEWLMQNEIIVGWNKGSGAAAIFTFQYEIPVTFHLIQPTIRRGFVPHSRVTRYIEYLNAAFLASSAPFVFRLQGTTRTFSEDWAERCGDSDAEAAYKSKLKRGGAEMLNIYLCTKIGGTTTGFSYLPFQQTKNFVKDGVVLAERDHDVRLNTLVHEVVRIANNEIFWSLS